MATFDERFTGATDDQSSQDQIAATPQYKMVPIDFDPFNVTTENANTIAANRVQRSVTKRDNVIPVSGRSEELTTDTADKLYGLHGKERYQFFPEKIARNIGDIVMREPIQIDPETGFIGFEQVSKAMDVAGLMGGATLGIKPGAATLGSGAVRPMLNATKNEVAPAFYSAVEHAVTNIQQPKMTGQQWLGTLANRPGVKPEELDWIGLKQYLLNNAEKVITKPEVEAFIKDNKVTIKEVDNADINDPLIKYLNESFGPATKHIQNANDITDAKQFNSAFRETTKGLTDEEILSAARKSEEYNNVGDTKYGPKQHPKLSLPGGENYREKLLTLPKPSIDKFKADYTAKTGVDLSTYTPEQINRLREQTGGIIGIEYKSSHWNEPNVLAHVRMNDRMIEGKKALHIEEIQSDWHQAGRDKGYKSDWKAKLIKEAPNDNVKSIWEVSNGNGEFKVFANSEKEAIDKTLKDTGIVSVPDAPFKKSWHELALKRMLREAAEKGYDRLSWTPGEAQAARYDLSQQVNALHYRKNNDGTYTLQADLKNGTLHDFENLHENKLADNVGKDVAKQIIESKGTESATNPKHARYGMKQLTGAELKVGGEGMKGFYDQIIPKTIEKIGKEHGVKVKQGNVKVDDAGFVSGEQIMDKLGIAKNKQSEYWQSLTSEKRDALFEEYRHRNELIHYIDIPQSLKDHAMKRGFPLFSSSPLLVPVDYNPFEKKQ